MWNGISGRMDERGFMDTAMRQQDNRIRVRMTVAYDGTNYHGWQVQNNAVTIESVLNDALSQLLGEDIRVIGASRTDAGVHALGNIAVFDTISPIPAEKMAYAVNARLPEDIRVIRSEQVASDWHPRKCASRKTYEYKICLGEFLQPVKRLYYHHVYRRLDIEGMRKAAGYLIGEHDFKSFCQENAQVESTVRTIYSIELLHNRDDREEELIIRVVGGGFLYNMVRIIVGTLLEVGYGRLRPEDMQEILAAKQRSCAGPTAPAKGLTLVSYMFEEEREHEFCRTDEKG